MHRIRIFVGVSGHFWYPNQESNKAKQAVVPQSESQSLIIDTAQLGRRFGSVEAVQELNLQIPQGQVVGFLGPNGAGKTTTIRMLCGSLMPTTGQAFIAGHHVVRERLEAQRQIGYLPESAPLYPEMRVIELLKFRAQLQGLRGLRANHLVAKAIRRCWLDAVQRRPIGQLSKGYRQRVGLAAALLHEPQLIVLDEPTSGLDPVQIREFRGLIRELAGAHTILLSTHILSEVEMTCDRVVIIAQGRVRADGTLAELREAASKTRRYVIETTLGSAPQALLALPGVNAVDGVALDDRWRRLTVEAKPDAPDLREMLGACIVEGGGAVRELRLMAPSLEQLFVQATATSTEGLALSEGLQ
ncbi:MAG: ABC transporter ATP-binding protein [Phycisphaerales bacterium]|nr:ABC transporter ATP-binding protein [Phycisphaerales bacterium]